MSDDLFFPHGGYKKLITYKLGVLIYDATVAFCNQYISIKSRTHDQMVQAARSGVANIAEGSQVSGTSKKIELKLIDIARGSQSELLFDYERFLAQRELPVWDSESAPAKFVRETRPQTLPQLRRLMVKLVSDLSDQSDLSDKNNIKQEVAANTMICLIYQEIFLLNRQLARLGGDFEKNGGFTERMYHIRMKKRNADSGEQ